MIEAVVVQMRRALILVVAAAAALVPLPRSVVERTYSNGLYAALQPLVTSLSNRTSVALLDIALVLGAAALAILAVATIRRRRGALRAAADLVVSIAAASAVLYLAFLIMWGFNYRRVPLAAKLAYDSGRVSPAAAADAGRVAIAELNRLYAPSHASGWATADVIDPGLAGAFAETERLLGARRLATPALPKLTILQPYFQRAGVSGMTDPYFLETLIDRTLLPFERPYVVAHEWAHLAGYADEGEANFVAWLTCVRAREPEQYSAWLALYDDLVRSAAPRDRAALRGALADGVRADLRAVNDRLRRNISPALATAGWRAYDRYLKANRVAEGNASYDTVVRLMLGTTFGPGWHPKLRPS